MDTKNAKLLLARDLDDIVNQLESWAKKNGVTKDRKFFDQVERIYNVSHTLKALHAGVK